MPHVWNGALSDHELLKIAKETEDQRRAIDSQATALIAAKAAQEKHARNLLILDVRSLSNVTDYFLICTAESTRQLDALKEHIGLALSRWNCPIRHAEGTGSWNAASAPWTEQVQWLLLDCGDVVIHLFDERSRVLYRLEDLWRDAWRVNIPQNLNALSEEELSQLKGTPPPALQK
ncbi:MAG: ribosome silencing factor [Candidatus Omnitrophica bacterium]|nr:ribosome silencing factor [Candidatus Omnitrophota bacterium]